jgi:hypothetical protein
MARGVRDRAVCPRRWALAAWALVLAAPASSSAAQAPAAPANPATPPATDAPGRLPGASQLQGPADPLVEGPAAAPGQLQGPSGVSAEGPAAPAVATKPSERWIKRFRPKERHRLELGVFGGVFLPNAQHELYEPAKATWAPYARVAGAIGLRVAYLPIPYVGAELDAAVMPSTLDATYVSSGGRADAVRAARPRDRPAAAGERGAVRAARRRRARGAQRRCSAATWTWRRTSAAGSRCSSTDMSASASTSAAR